MSERNGQFASSLALVKFHPAQGRLGNTLGITVSRHRHQHDRSAKRGVQADRGEDDSLRQSRFSR